MSVINVVKALGSASDDFALTLEREGSAMVVESFRNKAMITNTGNPLVVTKVDTAGITSQYIRKAWTPRPDDFKIGGELKGQNYGFAEKFIPLDPDPIIAHAAVSKHYRRASHFEMVKPILQGMVDEVTRERDRRAFLAVHKAARASADYDSQGVLQVSAGGNNVQVTDGTSVANRYPLTAAGALTFRGDIDALRQLARERDIPDEGSELYITPRGASVLAKDTAIYDVQYSQMQNPNNLVRAAVGMIAGFNVFVVPGTDRMPTTNVNSGYPSSYLGNFAYSASVASTSTGGTPVAVAMFKGPEGAGAIGIRQLGPVDVEQDYKIENQGDLMAVSVWQGITPLDAYLAGAITVYAS